MEADWQFYPAPRGGHQAFVFFDQAYAASADTDARPYSLKIRAQLKRPAPDGFPGEDEHADLAVLQQSLIASIAALDGVMVGRITHDGVRVFYFYVNFLRDTASDIVRSVGVATRYDLKFMHRVDRNKRDYWGEVHPQPDDLQVIADMRVLDSMEAKGDVQDAVRGITHRVRMVNEAVARDFAAWANSAGYRVDTLEVLDTGAVTVEFVHAGTLLMLDITRHTVAISRAARERRGEYIGWQAPIQPQD
ncbi:hypothetical protein BH10PSE17_BH10PSE17_18890 [soil metagenome]